MDDGADTGITVAHRLCGAVRQKGEKMAISENKMQIVINNYFNSECNIDTTIRTAFEKGFRIGVAKALHVQPEQRWIPCSEKMPEKGGYYLVTCGDDVRSQEVDCYDHGNNRFVFYNVIAWMPLPEPYKEEQE